MLRRASAVQGLSRAYQGGRPPRRRHGRRSQAASGHVRWRHARPGPGWNSASFPATLIALATGVALSHNTFDAVLYLGVCDKIVPGLIMAAGTFGYLPGLFVPAGPMVSGLPMTKRPRCGSNFAAGEVGRDKLMEAEMASYHGPGTCTFYGTANSNQMLMEFMGPSPAGRQFREPRHAAARRADRSRRRNAPPRSPRLATTIARSATSLTKRPS